MSHTRTSVQDALSRLATLGEPIIIPLECGQLAYLGSMDDADYIIQDEVLPHKVLLMHTDATSRVFSVFKECDDAEKLADVLYGTRPNVVLAGDMSEYD